MRNTSYIKSNNLETIQFADNKSSKSEKVFTISHPIGLDFSYSSGQVSSIRKYESYGSVVQSTVPIGLY